MNTVEQWKDDTHPLGDRAGDVGTYPGAPRLPRPRGQVAVSKLQGWDNKKTFEALERPFDPDAPQFIDYKDHVERYGGELNPHDAEH